MADRQTDIIPELFAHKQDTGTRHRMACALRAMRHKVTVKEIAEEVGVDTKTIYNYYKDEIFRNYADKIRQESLIKFEDNIAELAQNALSEHVKLQANERILEAYNPEIWDKAYKRQQLSNKGLQDLAVLSQAMGDGEIAGVITQQARQLFGLDNSDNLTETIEVKALPDKRSYQANINSKDDKNSENSINSNKSCGRVSKQSVNKIQDLSGCRVGQDLVEGDGQTGRGGGGAGFPTTQLLEKTFSNTNLITKGNTDVE